MLKQITDELSDCMCVCVAILLDEISNARCFSQLCTALRCFTKCIEVCECSINFSDVSNKRNAAVIADLFIYKTTTCTGVFEKISCSTKLKQFCCHGKCS